MDEVPPSRMRTNLCNRMVPYLIPCKHKNTEGWLLAPSLEESITTDYQERVPELVRKAFISHGAALCPSAERKMQNTIEWLLSRYAAREKQAGRNKQ